VDVISYTAAKLADNDPAKWPTQIKAAAVEHASQTPGKKLNPPTLPDAPPNKLPHHS